MKALKGIKKLKPSKYKKSFKYLVLEYCIQMQLPQYDDSLFVKIDCPYCTVYSTVWLDQRI